MEHRTASSAQDTAIAKYLHYLPAARVSYKSRRAGRRSSWISASDTLAAIGAGNG